MGHAAQLAQSWTDTLEGELSVGLSRIRAEVIAVAEQDVAVMRAAFQLLLEWKLRGSLKVALLQALHADEAAPILSGSIETEQICQLRIRLKELREALRTRENQECSDGESRSRLAELERRREILCDQCAELAKSLELGSFGDAAVPVTAQALDESKQDRMRERADVQIEQRHHRELDKNGPRATHSAD